MVAVGLVLAHLHVFVRMRQGNMEPQLVESLIADRAHETAVTLVAGQVLYNPAAPGAFRGEHFSVIGAWTLAGCKSSNEESLIS